MPNDLSIQTAPGANAGSEPIGNAQSPAATLASAEQAAPAASPTPNPTLELNAALGLVVIQFRSDTGAITSSIPTQQQINAYQLWQETQIGPPPSLGSDVVTPQAAGATTRTTAPAPTVHAPALRVPAAPAQVETAPPARAQADQHPSGAVPGTTRHDARGV